MRYLIPLILLAGCTAGNQTKSPMPPTQGKESVEYFDAPFNQVVDAALAAVSDLGMYVEDQHRASLDMVITARSAVSGLGDDNLVRITIERPTVQGVAVRVGRTGTRRLGYNDQAEALLRRIELKLIG